MFIVQAVAPQCSSVERITYTLLRFVNLPRTVSVVFNVLFSLYSFSIEIDVIFVFRNNYYSQTVTMSHTKCLFTSHGSFLQKEKRKEILSTFLFVEKTFSNLYRYRVFRK